MSCWWPRSRRRCAAELYALASFPVLPPVPQQLHPLPWPTPPLGPLPPAPSPSFRRSLTPSPWLAAGWQLPLQPLPRPSLWLVAYSLQPSPAAPSFSPYLSAVHLALTHTHTHTPVCLRGLCDRVPGRGVDFRPLFDPRPPARTKVYPMLLTSASGPQVGLPGKISGPGAGLSREAAQNWQFPVIPAPPAPGAKLSREAAQN